ncbi:MULTISPECIES: carbohydrate porin [unclassified Acinetobacter]|uniref:maltoporin n=1 Tax=unclassified Acinetobacter TaxID=196816 RepID=UPI0015D3151E|nr:MULTISPECIES: carbohydrate porin [unclassified Acinetobacter]MDM1759185.1 carbohydrate porin [Acinetobacter sp. 256-1]
MKKTLWMYSAALLVSSQFVSAVEVNGYFRTGMGGTDHGDMQECFKLTGAPSKYRLGNECEQYGEIFASQELAELSDHSKISINGMMQFYNDYGKSLKFSGDSGYTRMNQIYIDWTNVSFLNGGNFWAGRRYYNRNDINMSDFFYWNESGTGFGIDHYKLDNFALSYVFSRKDDLFQDKYINRHNFTVSDIKLNETNKLNLGVSYIDDDNDGLAFTIQNITSNVLNGKNTIAFQYGEGPGIGLGYTGDVSLNRDNTAIRILDILDWQSPNKVINGQAQILYQINDYEQQENAKWLSIGTRTSYVVSDHFKLTGEIGYDQIKQGDETRDLTKITFAPTFTLHGNGYNDRPELRLYYTYAFWNASEQRMRDLVNPNSSFYNTSSGSNIGVQLEHSW